MTGVRRGGRGTDRRIRRPDPRYVAASSAVFCAGVGVTRPVEFPPGEGGGSCHAGGDQKPRRRAARDVVDDDARWARTTVPAGWCSIAVIEVLLGLDGDRVVAGLGIGCLPGRGADGEPGQQRGRGEEHRGHEEGAVGADHEGVAGDLGLAGRLRPDTGAVGQPSSTRLLANAPEAARGTACSRQS